MVSIYDFANRERLSHNGDISIHPASVIKTMYMLMYLEQVKMGNRALDEVYTLREEDKYGSPGSRVTGSGILQFEPPGSRYTWGELLRLMISFSDNVAANLFIDNLGMDNINARIKQYGLRDTCIVRKIRQMIPGDNHSNADDMTQVLVALKSGKFIDGELYNFAIDIMRQAIYKKRIDRYTPGDVIIANKTGTLDSIVGDSGLIFFPDREPLAMTIFIAGNGGNSVDEGKGEECIGVLARRIISYYRG